MLKRLLAVPLLLALAVTPALARGHGGYSHSGGSSRSSYSSHSYSSPGYHSVRAYTTRRGTYVDAHKQTNGDSHFGNNWSTKGNTNPFTGKAGTKVTPPHGEKW